MLDGNDSSQAKSAHSRTGSFPQSQQYSTASDIEDPQFFPVVDEETPLFKQHDVVEAGRSTFAQTVFNSVNVLAGIAILSLPLALKYSGWILGISIFFFCLGLTNYTAKILAKCMDLNPKCRLYADVAQLAYGEKAKMFVGAMFLLDIFNASVAAMILVGDSLKALFPGSDLTFLKLLAFFVIIPTTWMPIHLLSYTSLLGILSAGSLILVVVYDGLSKAEAPGSLLDPADTTFWPTTWLTVPLAFGLINAGFAGHAVLPSLYRDMANPRKARTAWDTSYLITGAFYLVLAVCGYLMFGSQTMQEITQNIMNTPGYSVFINSLVVWMIVVNPLSKFSLILQPIHTAVEMSLFRVSFIHDCLGHGWKMFLSKSVLRTLVGFLVVVTAIIYPGFDRALSLLGSLFSFFISGIFPLMCHLKLFGHQLSSREFILNVVLLGVSCVMATLGTIWTFFPDEWLGKK